MLIGQILMVLLGAKTDDSVELAVTALKESGALFQEEAPAVLRQWVALPSAGPRCLGQSRHPIGRSRTAATCP